MNQNPPTFEIRRLGAQDVKAFKALVSLFNLVFEEPRPSTGGEAQLQSLLDDRTFVALAAFSEQELVGGLTAYELPLYYSDSSEIFIYDLAIKAEFQRAGIGRGLIRRLKEYCLEQGIREFFVMADEEDAHAVEFYRATGGRPGKVVNFVYTANKE
jgi:aminoglycoside 3-N-acetyltransferase I